MNEKPEAFWNSPEAASPWEMFVHQASCISLETWISSLGWPGMDVLGEGLESLLRTGQESWGTDRDQESVLGSLGTGQLVFQLGVGR